MKLQITFSFFVSVVFVLFVPTIGGAATAGNPIRLGTSYPKTGPTSARAKEVIHGAEIFLQKLNQDGGLNSQKVELIQYDDGYEPKAAYENVRKMVEQDKVLSLLLVYGTPSNSAILPYVKEKNVPYFCPLSGASFLRSPVISQTINLRNSYDLEAESLVAFLTGKKKAKKIGLLVQKGDVYGTAGHAAVMKALSKRKMNLAAEGGYKRNTENDPEALKVLQDAGVDAVIMFSAGKISTEFIKAWDTAKHPVVFAIASPAVFSEFAEQVKESAAEIYAVQSFPFFETNSPEVVKQYVSACKTQNEVPTASGFEGYLCANLAVETIKRAGAQPDGQKILQAVDHLGDLDLGGFKMHFDPKTRQGSEKSWLIQMKDGKYMSAEF